ncbi:MAG: hypothetical protein ACW99A_14945 [Candidatus Kariarchaeaceae archaeon]|jgi:uncharacterized cupredoxin-like copper-binding protein
MKIKFFTLFLLMLLIFYANTTLASEGHEDEHGDEHEVADHCVTPTEEITITVGENSGLAYDKNEYKVSKNTCVEVTFVNAAIIEHDVSIDEVHEEFETAHIHLANNTDGHDGDGHKTLHIQTPDKDTEYEIYCSVPGHKTGGMVAKLIVGEGNPDDDSLPGFGLFTAFAVFITLVILQKRQKLN